MEPELRRISEVGLSAALAKATVYRNLNEPEEAESICRDVLAIDPQNAEGLRLLGLSITDQFSIGGDNRYSEVERIFDQLTEPYDRLYYTGLLHERRVKTELRAGRTASSLAPLLERAMACFFEAEKIRPVGNDESILRWNSCIRLLKSRADFESGMNIEPLETYDGPPT